MKPMNSDQLVTVMGGAATNPSWIAPLPEIFNTTKPAWGLAPKPARPGTSWLRSPQV